MDADRNRAGRFRRPWSVLAGLFLGAFCILFLGIGLDAVGNFIDTPSLVITGGIAGSGLLVGFGWKNLMVALAVYVGGSAQDAKSARLAMDVSIAGMWITVASGVVGTLIGSINMLAQGIDDPSVLASGCAVALITVLYGVMMVGVFVVLRYRAKLALGEWEDRRCVYHAPKPRALSPRGVMIYGILLPLWIALMAVLGGCVIAYLVCFFRNHVFG